ncbi:MAG: hypothetical protein ACK4MQ_04175 [Hyphomonas sp.]
MKKLAFLLIAALAAPAMFAEPPDDEPGARQDWRLLITASDVRGDSERYIAMDARFGDHLTTRAEEIQARPGFEPGYEEALAGGWFEGSAPDYAMWMAVSELMQPVYGWGAAIYCPPNDPAYVVMMRHWRGETIDCSTYSRDYGRGSYVWTGVVPEPSDSEMAED